MSDAAATSGGDRPAPDTTLDGSGYLKLLLAAAALGVPVAALAALFAALMHQAEHAVWVSLPEALGHSAPPWWLVVAAPATAGLIVAATLRMPGHGGHAAIDGLQLEPATPRALVSVLIAAAASISLGPVVGPEAPLLAIGLTLGAVVARRSHRGELPTLLLAFAGAFAAISTVFGGPLPAALMLLEFVALSGKVPAAQIGRFLLPGFLAAGTGALVFTGLGDWGGVNAMKLSVPGLPEYQSVRVADLALTPVLAALAAAVVVTVLRLARVLSQRWAQRPSPLVLIGGGAAIGVLAVLARAIGDAPTEFVLSSGSTAMPSYVQETSATVLLAAGSAKALALMITAAAFFRGGLIFPAVSLGVLLAVLGHVLVPGLALTPAVTAGIAAGATAALRAPFFGTLLASLLVGTAVAPNVAPIAIIAATVAWVVTIVIAPEPSDEATAGPTDGDVTPALA